LSVVRGEARSGAAGGSTGWDMGAVVDSSTGALSTGSQAEPQRRRATSGAGLWGSARTKLGSRRAGMYVDARRTRRYDLVPADTAIHIGYSGSSYQGWKWIRIECSQIRIQNRCLKFRNTFRYLLDSEDNIYQFIYW
jgi:hypothetical protein